MADPAPRSPLVELTAVMGRLRVECDWKAAQTHRTLARHLLEETYETLEAIDTGDQAHLREELGDLLLQVYFHAAIAAENGEFDIDDVARDLLAKLVRRNPHVFGEASASGAAQVNELWESVKATEKQRGSVLDGIPPQLPALAYADKVLERLARRPSVMEPAEATQQTVSTGSSTELLGDRLLALVAECRAAGVDPEQSLRDAVRRLL
ncbi:MazG nucleotide pyrophosphohydrolase [metagenome]|uniref:MazG nucleotide pyrophosphohydrolase n=1 Tax=metagenome TaxID=256318 RepID=A0A2P2BZD6_9ZZZZ